jgi:hypothetical protein
MKILKTILATSILVMVVASCGNSKPVAVETTVTTINYGTDCNRTVSNEIVRLQNELSEAWSKATQGVPTRSQYTAKVRALRDLRLYIRSLDIPLVNIEQIIFTNVIDQYLDAYNTYWESGKRDLSVNDYITDYQDASYDFNDSFNNLCALRS